MTPRYIITARPDLGPFGSATEALIMAALLGLEMDWEVTR